MPKESPKEPLSAWHDWRNDGRELAIVVMGVLIALLAQEVVQGWEWQQKIAAADDAMKREMFWDNGPEMIERIAIQPCINAQLDGIRGAVQANRPRAEIAGLVDRLYVPYVSYDTVAYRDVSASDVPIHMPKARENAWTQAYAMMPMVDSTEAQETVDAARIKALKRTGGPLSDAEQIALLQAYAMMPMVDSTEAQETVDAARIKALKRTGGPLSDAEQIALLQAVEEVRGDGARMMSGIHFTMQALPQLHGSIDKGRLDQGLQFARLHYGSCIRAVPADWPAKHLPPLPKGIVPGLATDAVSPWQTS
jgi:hypothetical protein